jgi:cytochrome b6-f complex iron-sulfur subunit
MSTGAVLAIAIIAVVVLAAVFLVVTARRSDRNAATGLLARETVRRDREARRRSATGVLGDEPVTGREVERAVVLARREGGTDVVAAEAQLPAVRPPLEPEALAVTRRQFFNRSITLMMTAGIGGFGASILAFLWPSLSGGFGSRIRVGKIDDILAEIESLKGPKYVAEGRTYLVHYPKEAVTKARDVYAGAVLEGMEAGVVALYQKCPHLGCRVPWCGTSQWFECPCHGSQYNRVGEKKGGPAPRGMDRFAVNVSGGIVTVDTAARTEGPPIGVNTTGQEAEGPHCVGGGH